MRKKKIFTLVIIQLLFVVIFGAVTQREKLSTRQDYILIAWNDLGMHCANQDFSKVVVLPPFNTLYAQVIKKGSVSALPQVLTDSLTLSYEIPGNTYSVGKTNFWSYEDQLFGTSLPNDTGLTGLGLTGELTPYGDHFVAEGIPITPFSDSNLVTENPYQLAFLSLYDTVGTLLATTQPVIPVSNEIGCVSSNCHPNQQHILNEHDNVSGFNQNGPVLCASCHSSNALGTSGTPGLESLSEVIHDEHKNVNDCYKCHPGQNTQCHRGVMNTEGYSCVDCHGNTENVAETISNGRQPWLDEPSCASSGCHTSIYGENPNTLYRLSKGHGGLYCSACHGSPHAIYPSQVANDNVQNIALQGFAGILSDCSVCHGIIPNWPGPHGILVGNIETLSSESDATKLNMVYPNPASYEASIDFSVAGKEKVSIEIINSEGKSVIRLLNRLMTSGSYQIDFPVESLQSGIYYARLSSKSSSQSIKFVKI
jgi:hypothetical protein